MSGFPRPAARMGWADYQHNGAVVAMSAANTFYPLPNNALGGFTTKQFWLPGYSEIWNPLTGRFDFSGLHIGDTVDFRVSFIATTPSPNTRVRSRLELAIGDPGAYSLLFDETTFKTAAAHARSSMLSIYIGNAITLNNPARFAVAMDDAGGSVAVDGWFCRVALR